MREKPKKMQKSVVDRLVVGHETQSESLKPFNCMSESKENNKPSRISLDVSDSCFTILLFLL